MHRPVERVDVRVKKQLLGKLLLKCRMENITYTLFETTTGSQLFTLHRSQKLSSRFALNLFLFALRNTTVVNDPSPSHPIFGLFVVDPVHILHHPVGISTLKPRGYFIRCFAKLHAHARTTRRRRVQTNTTSRSFDILCVFFYHIINEFSSNIVTSHE